MLSLDWDEGWQRTSAFLCGALALFYGFPVILHFFHLFFGRNLQKGHALSL
jgi:hypothetical protein